MARMRDMEKLISVYSEAIEEHRAWLKRSGERRLKKWEDLLKANPESAICEAKARKLLSDNGVDIRPYEDLSQGGPDFRCSKQGRTFCAEITCMSIESVAKESGLNPFYSPDVDDCAHDYLTNKIRYEICNKTPQCAKAKAPCVVVIATLHSQASECCFDEPAAEELLTATTYITRDLDTETHEPIGDAYEITRLENSAFIRPSKHYSNWIEHARTPVSAVLLCGFGSFPPSVIACHHPNPNYPFDRTLPPQIKFCRLAGGYQAGPIEVEWI